MSSKLINLVNVSDRDAGYVSPSLRGSASAHEVRRARGSSPQSATRTAPLKEGGTKTEHVADRFPSDGWVARSAGVGTAFNETHPVRFADTPPRRGTRARLAVFCSSFLFLVPGVAMAVQNDYGCEICPTGQKFEETQSGFECVVCNIPTNAHALEWAPDYCMAVTCEGTDCVIGANECPWDCDEGYINDGNGNCVQDTVTCDQSYYLPANSNSCELCTQHNYCVGGTFSPSDSDQGIDPCPNGETGNTRLGAYYCVPYKRLNTGSGLNAIMRNTIYPNNPDNFCIKPDGEDGVFYGGLSTEYMDNAIQIDADGQTYWLKTDEEFEGGGAGGAPRWWCDLYLGGLEKICPEAGTEIWNLHGVDLDCEILGSGEWKLASCNYGEYPAWGDTVLRGNSKCTDAAGESMQVGEPGNTPGSHCWCQMTAPSDSGWVYGNTDVWEVSCDAQCAVYCSREFGNPYYSGGAV